MSIEDRVADLEAKILQLSAFLDTAGIYQSRYAGEEIDEYLDRIAGGFDTSDFADKRLSNLDTPQLALMNLGAGVRPNLVGNWLLSKAINQRGKTTYTGGFAFAVDMWRLGPKTTMNVSGSGKVTVVGDGSGESYIFQYLESLDKGTYTYSVLFSENTGVVTLTTKQTDEGSVSPVSSRDASGILSLTFNTENLGTAVGLLRIGATGSVCPIAAKLESGSGQTLAYKGQDGVWKMIPQSGEKLTDRLLECQRNQLALWRYFISPAVHFQPNYIDFSVPIPVQMRTTPTLTQEDFTVFSDKSGGQSGFVLSIVGMSSNAIRVRATKEGHGLSMADGVRIEVNVERAILNAGL